ncbi:glycosyltransferase family 52 [Shewanella salipaludis]|uniref:glycosyltransferase family 52 n=1 Tax=Shewanella salipaludis TaxID=2723052 RepID=UPI003140C415
MVYEARNSKELLYSVILACSNVGREALILNLSSFTFPENIFDIRVLHIPYQTTMDKIRYHLFGYKFLSGVEHAFVFHDFSPIVRISFPMRPSLVEHGLVNYLEKEDIYGAMPIIPRFLSKLISGSVCGRNKKISSIYAHFPRALPSDIINKGVALDIIGKWSAMPLEVKAIVNSIFGYKSPESNFSLLVTQPIEIFDGISEKDKINIYTDVANTFSSNDGKLLLKRHPLETTQYSSYIKDAEMLEGEFPLELLMLNDIEKVNKVVTLFSSAVIPFIGLNEVVWLGGYRQDALVTASEMAKLPKLLMDMVTQY